MKWKRKWNSGAPAAARAVGGFHVCALELRAQDVRVLERSCSGARAVLMLELERERTARGSVVRARLRCTPRGPMKCTPFSHAIGRPLSQSLRFPSLLLEVGINSEVRVFSPEGELGGDLKG